MPELEQPYISAFVVCQAIVTDEGDWAQDLIGISRIVVADTLPVQLNLEVYVAIRGAIGRYDGLLEILSPHIPSLPMGQYSLSFEVTPTAFSGSAITKVPMVFEMQGPYEFRVAIQDMVDYLSWPIIVVDRSQLDK